MKKQTRNQERVTAFKLEDKVPVVLFPEFLTNYITPAISNVISKNWE